MRCTGPGTRWRGRRRHARWRLRPTLRLPRRRSTAPSSTPMCVSPSNGGLPSTICVSRATRHVRLDSTLVAAFLYEAAPRNFAVSVESELALLTQRLWEVEGEPARALRAARRRHYAWGPESTRYLSSLLKDEGRLAALTGDRQGAIRAYEHYLALRSDPEP